LDEVWCQEDVYQGDYSRLAPDIVLVLNPAYEFGPATERRTFTEVSASKLKRSSANHRPDGMFVMAGPGVKEGVDMGSARLIDAPATILWALGLDVPNDVDGRVLIEAFDEELVERHPVHRSDAGITTASEGVYSEEEARSLEGHLRDLGYM
jgi:predicted AlkP superfamily phosphohydrolase/phosphomutase